MKNLIAVLLMFALVGCGGGAHMVLPQNSNPKADQAKSGNSVAESGLTFYTAIVPLVERKCSTCHGQGSALGNWLDYNQVLLKKDRILNRVVQKKDMPMGAAMTDAERRVFEKWFQEGAVEGSPVVIENPPGESQPPVVENPPSEAQPPIAENPPSENPPVNNPPEVIPPVAPNPPGGNETPVLPTPPGQSESIVFIKDIKPLFERACSLCHNAGSGDYMPNWLEYSIAYNKRTNILDRVVVKKDMPMGVEFSEQDRELVKKWIEQGALFDQKPSEVGVN